ncbi:DEAD/DEAH box helicase [Thiofilum flexile]|uniref:DEAD/DEAH box helicase n=1 Tax=Thiofilum flexile TaxID=125627 RepID=UPI00035CDD9D|nr:DEAD/DEAH box helicase [Thiofilum flexile]
MDNQYLSDIRFDAFALHPELLRSLHESGFTQCSRIQAATLPYTLQGQDVTGQAQTGTGKTGAFLVSIFQHLLTHPLADPQPGDVRCLILAPTRELAIQVARDAEELGRHTGLRSVLVYGGAGYDKQRRQFESTVDVLIGTPGRIIDYYKQGVFRLDRAQALVLDEADRMFDMGFIQDVRYLLRKLPAPTERLNMLFSATLSQKVLELAYEHMDNPVPVKIESQTVSAANITEHLYFPANKEKIPLLIGLIRHLNPFRAIVFVNTKYGAEKVYDYLRSNRISAGLISGDVRQSRRERLLKDFEEGKYQILIATDVAARGLHISDVTHVFNFDLPQIAEDYVHRIGRTARAGASGEAHSFACEDTAFYLPEIEAYTDKVIPVSAIDPTWLEGVQLPSRSANPKRQREASESKTREREPRRERTPRSTPQAARVPLAPISEETPPVVEAKSEAAPAEATVTPTPTKTKKGATTEPEATPSSNTTKPRITLAHVFMGCE